MPHNWPYVGETLAGLHLPRLNDKAFFFIHFMKCFPTCFLTLFLTSPPTFKINLSIYHLSVNGFAKFFKANVQHYLSSVDIFLPSLDIPLALTLALFTELALSILN